MKTIIVNDQIYICINNTGENMKVYICYCVASFKRHFLLLFVLGDSTYHLLHSRTGPKQRGRPCTYKSTIVTNRLLLRLHLVRKDTGSTWNNVPLLFVDLCKESNIPVVLVHPLIITVLQCIRVTKVSDIEAFLSTECQLEWIGDYS